MLGRLINLKARGHQLRNLVRNYTSRHKKKKRPKYKVAMILSGCGVFDGTEIHEAAATAVHLCRKSMKPLFYSPFIAQSDVVNHSTGEKADECRNAFVESARIARGEISPLNELNIKSVDAVVFPGGFGAAKNLSNFATASSSCILNLDVCKIILDCHKERKPMGFMCISSILAARMIRAVRITLGARGNETGQSPEDWPHAEAIEAAIEMGASVEIQDVTGISIDMNNLVVTTPAFMYQGDFYEVFLGIGKLIDQLECLMKIAAAEKEDK